MSEKIWSFKYEPVTLDQMILAPETKDKLEKCINELPNIMLYGQPGTGKGTFAKIFFETTQLDKMWINASDQTGIDNMRDSVKPFAHGGSINLKYVIFNESEALSSGKSGAQKMLKELMELTQKKTRFLYMTNEIQNMNPALRSRCMEVNLDHPPIKNIVLFMSKILKSEKVKFEAKILVDLVKKCYPDIRKTIQSCQENTINNELIGTNIYTAEALFNEILENMKTKDLDKVRSLIKSNPTNYKQLYEFLFNKAMTTDDFKSPGAAIIQIGDHLRFNETTCNGEINFMHMIFYMLWKEII
jgi:DNA polymerase III delta prime subunit